MKDFIFSNPTKIIFGKKAMNQIKPNLEVFGNKVFMVYGKGSIKRNKIYNKVLEQLKEFKVEEFVGIEPNPRVETVQQALDSARKFSPDIILAVGGGSVIDASKLLSASLFYQGDPWDFLIKNVNPKKYVPLAVVLTLSATGSEMNNGAVITNWQKREKLFFIRDQLYPKFSILDPQNTFSVPREQTAYGIVDAFSHVLEQYLHLEKDAPLQDRFSESILLTLIENAHLVIKKPNNYKARANIMLSAAMALNNLIGVGAGEDWATHMIEHELSAFYDIPHGAGLAIITPKWMKAVKKEKERKLIQYGKRIWGFKGTDKKTAEKAIEKTYQFFQSMGIKMSLREWGINSQFFPKIIDRLVEKRIGEKPLSRQRIQKILYASL